LIASEEVRTVTYSKRCLRTPIVTLVVAVCLGSFGATSASAAPHFKVAKETITETLEIQSEEDQDFVLLVKGANLEVLCEKFLISDGLIFVTGKGLAKPQFTECVARSISPLKTLPCTVTVTSSPVEGSLILLGKTTYALIEPDEVSVFATLNFSGAMCVLPEHVNITGSLVLVDCGATKDMAEELVRHLVEQAPHELFPEHVLSYGKNEATLDGSTRLMLKEPLFNMFWSGVGG
jgi:hypothetical protein